MTRDLRQQMDASAERVIGAQEAGQLPDQGGWDNGVGPRRGSGASRVADAAARRRTDQHGDAM